MKTETSTLCSNTALLSGNLRYDCSAYKMGSFCGSDDALAVLAYIKIYMFRVEYFVECSSVYVRFTAFSLRWIWLDNDRNRRCPILTEFFIYWVTFVYEGGVLIKWHWDIRNKSITANTELLLIQFMYIGKLDTIWRQLRSTFNSFLETAVY